MYNVCILVVDKNNDVKHFNIIKDDIERTTLIAERELTNFGKIISDDVVGRIRHYKLMTKEDSKITTLDAYIWLGQFVKKYAIRATGDPMPKSQGTWAAPGQAPATTERNLSACLPKKGWISIPLLRRLRNST